MSLAVVILAAGKGTRMKSPLPKVLHILGGEPLILHVLDTVLALNPQHVLVVVGFKKERVLEVIKPYAVKHVEQREQLGTGHAVLLAEESLKDFNGDVLVLCGDTPLLRVDTLKELCSFHREKQAVATILTAELENPFGYGRIIRDSSGLVSEIVEEKDADPTQKRIKEINSGTYVFRAKFLFDALKEIRPDNVQREYYLTDVIKIARQKALPVAALKAKSNEEILGINSQFELALAEKIFQRRLRERFMAAGVTFVSPEHVYLEKKVQIAPGVVIFPFVSLRGATEIGQEAVIESHCDLKDVKVLPGARVSSGTTLSNGLYR
ncbi:bifunctional UDP-N-acetylglucosamine diphosphorylase/glucosamine-1-phosphate N-acetyltransferase GlmU [Thermodesulfatator atlanticus]|uniref:bifunctional UDP-N-acetylglucosamine diphosphorylase/glucosamine-1-phosphate N-acetyltransferase GlmU n=1 Tax=Thermodesulfatator atlanticus TaxID=501497 RepID=UPI0003B78541|nr:sugar phosphate nucleotidyltransferase [Thermodesulfatator atlanticus]